MVDIHIIVGVVLIVSNAVAGIWGGASWYRRRPSVGFWYSLRVSQVAVVLQIAVGAILVLGGREATDELHYVYGILPLLVTLLGESVRIAASDHELEGLDYESLPKERQRAVAMAISRRETGIMAVSALVILGLGLRAAFLSSAV